MSIFKLDTKGIQNSRPTDEERATTLAKDLVKDLFNNKEWKSLIERPVFDNKAKNVLANLQDKHNFDPNNLLDDVKVNPEFSKTVKKFLIKAIDEGFKPIVHEAYRSIDRSRALYLAYLNGGPKASDISLHNFGLAVDIWLKNSKGNSSAHPDPDKLISWGKWAKFIKIGASFGLINAEKHNDSDHFEYHPAWRTGDWVSARRFAQPIYNATNGSELDKLKAVWRSAGL